MWMGKRKDELLRDDDEDDDWWMALDVGMALATCLLFWLILVLK
jgi:hypothetical protein